MNEITEALSKAAIEIARDWFRTDPQSYEGDYERDLAADITMAFSAALAAAEAQEPVAWTVEGNLPAEVEGFSSYETGVVFDYRNEKWANADVPLYRRPSPPVASTAEEQPVAWRYLYDNQYRNGRRGMHPHAFPPTSHDGWPIYDPEPLYTRPSPPSGEAVEARRLALEELGKINWRQMFMDVHTRMKAGGESKEMAARWMSELAHEAMYDALIQKDKADE